jgi:hypothetical protein
MQAMMLRRHIEITRTERRRLKLLGGIALVYSKSYSAQAQLLFY